MSSTRRRRSCERLALEAVGLEKQFATRGLGRSRTPPPPAVDGVAIGVPRGTTSRWSVSPARVRRRRLLALLLPPTAGEIQYGGEPVLGFAGTELKRHRRNVQVVFQDPYASLDPHMTVERLVAEPLDVHREGSRDDRRARVRDLLELVGLTATTLRKHVYELSGGQAQRVAMRGH